MAAATITATSRRVVMGDVVQYNYTLTVANTNTLTVQGMKSIKWVGITNPLATDTAGATWSGNVITFATGGTITGMHVMVIGRD